MALEWAAAGFTDTLLGWKMNPEVVRGEKKEIHPWASYAVPWHEKTIQSCRR